MRVALVIACMFSIMMMSNRRAPSRTNHSPPVETVIKSLPPNTLYKGE